MTLNKFAFGALVVSAMGSAHAYVVDGGFESLVLTGGNLGDLLENYGPAAPVGAFWSNSSNYVLGIHTTYTEGGPLYFVAQEGSKAIDLTGAGNQGPVAVSQTLPLSAGQYLLSFFLGDINGGGYPLASSVEVLFGGSSLGVFSNSSGGATTNWMQVQVPFTSNGVNNTLTFSTTGLQLDSYTGLDNVTVTAAIPEPGSLAMVLAALAAAGLVARRRKSI